MASLAVTEFVINPASASRLISNPITNNTFFFFCFCFPKRGASLLLKSHLHSASRFRKANATTSSSSSDQYDQRQQEEEDEEENFQVVTAVRSKYNDIVIVDTPKSRMLLLDSTCNKVMPYSLNNSLLKFSVLLIVRVRVRRSCCCR